ncbi:aminoacetone oxidase family FAD-binding enzyme, partial [Patescibacteria group bacterium]|nr:aminoacetone oxidase family FAD-binding enzyme [Patescibacteria group bacterium]
IKSVRLKDKEITAHSYILATGGKSYSRTGSDGKGYKWAQKMGHKIIDLKPALTPIDIKEDWSKDLQGLSLKNVNVSVFQNNKKQDSRFGEMLFTHFGVSGPIIIDLSKKIGELLKTGKVILKIDLKPGLDVKTLDKRLQRDFKSNKDFKNYLPDLLPKKMGDLALRLTGINKNKKVNSISKDERKKIIEMLKGLTLTVKKLVGFNWAIVTSGGIDLKEIDSRTMKSKIIENLYFAGEIVDLDGPTGGYNLQICWTTGYAAGASAEFLK